MTKPRCTGTHLGISTLVYEDVDARETRDRVEASTNMGHISDRLISGGQVRALRGIHSWDVENEALDLKGWTPR